MTDPRALSTALHSGASPAECWEAMKTNRSVTVCSACLRASCWHGEFPCDAYRTANVRRVLVSDLDKLRREHPDYYSVEKVRAVTGRDDG